jgi:hypothetical protein
MILQNLFDILWKIINCKAVKHFYLEQFAEQLFYICAP